MGCFFARISCKVARLYELPMAHMQVKYETNRADAEIKLIYCEQSHIETLKTLDHDLLSCKITLCHTSLWNTAHIFI